MARGTRCWIYMAGGLMEWRREFVAASSEEHD
jgi:hypothetical protein